MDKLDRVQTNGNDALSAKYLMNNTLKKLILLADPNEN